MEIVAVWMAAAITTSAASLLRFESKSPYPNSRYKRGDHSARNERHALWKSGPQDSASWNRGVFVPSMWPPAPPVNPVISAGQGLRPYYYNRGGDGYGMYGMYGAIPNIYCGVYGCNFGGYYDRTRYNKWYNFGANWYSGSRPTVGGQHPLEGSKWVTGGVTNKPKVGSAPDTPSTSGSGAESAGGTNNSTVEEESKDGDSQSESPGGGEVGGLSPDTIVIIFE